MRIEGQFSPCGTFAYCGTWDVRSFSFYNPHNNSNTKLEGSGSCTASATSKATGMYIWRISSSKLERGDMKAIQQSLEHYKAHSIIRSSYSGSGNDEDSDGGGPELSDLEKMLSVPVPVSCCKW